MMERAALLALLRDRKTGWNLVADEVEERGSAVEVLRDTSGQAGPGQGTLFSRRATTDPKIALEQSLREIEAWTSEDVRLVTLLDNDYPSHLLTIHQRPPFLFYRGHLDAASSAKRQISGGGSGI